MQAAAWFEYLGYPRTIASHPTFCNDVVLGNVTASHTQEAVHQGCSLHDIWNAQGQGWQQCPPPKTPPSPTPQSASRHRISSKQPSTAAIYGAQGMSEAPLSNHWANNAAKTDAAVSSPGMHNMLVHGTTEPLLQLPKTHSGNPFASLHASLDDSSQLQDAAAAAAPKSAAAQAAAQAAAGAVVPPLALHRLPVPFGTALGRSNQPLQSRLAQESGAVLASSFTSASFSYSEVTSTGYTTRSPSPDPGLKQNFLHAAQAEPSGDSTLAVSNPLFGCTPRRGSPGELGTALNC